METVKVVDSNKDNHRGWKIINKDDMKPSDVIFGEPVKPPAKAKKVKKDG